MSEPPRTIQVFGKPIEKLIDVVSKGIGITYKPKAIRNEAEAKAFEIEKIAEAEAKAAIIKYEAESEIAERARQRLYHQEMQRQSNIDNIVNEAAVHLEEHVSEEPIDEDWRTRFFIKAQDVNSVEMQKIWGKILAGEINSPGNFSLRALDIIANLSKDEAEEFKKIAPLVSSGLFIFSIGDELGKYDINFGMKLVLANAGILLHHESISVNLKVKNEDYGQFRFQEKSYRIKNSKSANYTFPCYSLSPDAATLLKVIDVKPNVEYCNDFIKYYSDKGYVFTEA
jgi:hypothetical protein